MSQHTARLSQPTHAERGAASSPSDKATPDTKVEVPRKVIPFTSYRPGMAVSAAIRGEKVFLKLPWLGEVDLPSGPHLVWFAGAIALTALDLIDWPVAVLLMAGKALSDSERSEPVRTLGRVMERA